MAVATLAGCGSGAGTTTTVASRLDGWTARADPPGISQLAPDFSGLHPTATDHRALIRRGDVVRATSFVFPTVQEAREAERRGAGDDFQRALEKAFHADSRRENGGVRLVVARPAEPGADTVEVYLVRRGTTVTLAELVSAYGFPAGLRRQALAAVSR